MNQTVGWYLHDRGETTGPHEAVVIRTMRGTLSDDAMVSRDGEEWQYVRDVRCLAVEVQPPPLPTVNKTPRRIAFGAVAVVLVVGAFFLNMATKRWLDKPVVMSADYSPLSAAEHARIAGSVAGESDAKRHLSNGGGVPLKRDLINLAAARAVGEYGSASQEEQKEYAEAYMRSFRDEYRAATRKAW